MFSTLYLACKREEDWSLYRSSHFSTTQHDRSGADECLSTLDHFGGSFSEMNLSDCTVWNSRTNFPSLCYLFEEMNSGSEGRCSASLEKQHWNMSEQQ